MAKTKSNKSEAILASLLGNSEEKKGDYVKAEGYYRSAITHFCDAITKDKDTTHETMVNLGSSYLNLSSAYIRLKKYTESTVLLEEAIKNKHTSEEIYFNLGISYFHEKKYDESVQSFKDAIDKNNSCFSYHYSLGTAYKAKGDNANALNSFKLANTLEPNDTNAIIGLFWSHHQLIVASSTKNFIEDALKDFNSIVPSKHNKAPYEDYGTFIYEHMATLHLIENDTKSFNSLIAEFGKFSFKEDISQSLKDFALHKYNSGSKSDGVKMLLSLNDVGFNDASQSLSDIFIFCGEQELAIKALSGVHIDFADCGSII